MPHVMSSLACSGRVPLLACLLSVLLPAHVMRVLTYGWSAATPRSSAQDAHAGSTIDTSVELA
jgi:hypothetical protein